MTDQQNLSDLKKAAGTVNRVLEDDALVFAGDKVSEIDIINDVLDDISTIRLSDRDIKLEGLERNRKMIIAAVAKFKDEVYNGNVKRRIDAEHDDIVVELADRSVFATMVAGDFHNFKGTVATEGDTLEIVPRGSDTGYATLDDDEWLFFTGDIIDFHSDAIVSDVIYDNVDGKTQYNSEPVQLQYKDSDIQIGRVSAMLVKSRIDLDGYGSTGGKAEVFPVAIHIARGKLISNWT